MFERSETLKSTFKMVFKIKYWMVNHFKQILHVFLILDGVDFMQYHPTWFFSSFIKYSMKSVRLNGSNILSTIANFACSMKHWTRLNRPSAVTQSCFKKMFLKILQNVQEKTCAGVSFLLKFQPRGLQFC